MRVDNIEMHKTAAGGAPLESLATVYLSRVFCVVAYYRWEPCIVICVSNNNSNAQNDWHGARWYSSLTFQSDVPREGPMVKYEKRIASGDIVDGDSFQVIALDLINAFLA